jgi:hypothetical protein
MQPAGQPQQRSPQSLLAAWTMMMAAVLEMAGRVAGVVDLEKLWQVGGAVLAEGRPGGWQRRWGRDLGRRASSQLHCWHGGTHKNVSA